MQTYYMKPLNDRCPICEGNVDGHLHYDEKADRLIEIADRPNLTLYSRDRTWFVGTDEHQIDCMCVICGGGL